MSIISMERPGSVGRRTATPGVGDAGTEGQGQLRGTQERCMRSRVEDVADQWIRRNEHMTVNRPIFATLTRADGVTRDVDGESGWLD
jgi:hypothetical protein